MAAVSVVDSTLNIPSFIEHVHMNVHPKINKHISWRWSARIVHVNNA